MFELQTLEEVIAAEKAKYERVWEEPVYRNDSPAMFALKDIFRRAREVEATSLLAVGCGGGQAEFEMAKQGFSVVGVDIAANAVHLDFRNLAATIKPPGALEFQTMPIHEYVATTYNGESRHGLAYGIDVLEHIPEPMLDESLKAIAKAAKFGYFHIANFGDEFGATLGLTTLHPTVHGAGWWHDKLYAYWNTVYCDVDRDVRHGGEIITVYTALPRF